MNTVKQLTSTDSLRTLSPSELSLAQKILRTNMGLQPGESLLIVTDPGMLEREAALWFEAGKTLTDQVQLVSFTGMTENAQEPPAEVAAMMREAQVLMLQTTFSLSHTQARTRACQAGARAASLPGADCDMIMRTLDMDYAPIAERSRALAQALTEAQTATITAPNGTHLEFDVSGRAGYDDTGLYTEPGNFGNLPAGESFIAPVEGTTNGTLVVDGSWADVELDSPITVVIENGQAVKITGGKGANELQRQLAAVGDTSAYNIAELGIGVNPSANPRGTLLEAEKAFATIHCALGNNATIGGTVSVPFHSDGVVLSPRVYLDRKLVLEKGKFYV